MDLYAIASVWPIEGPSRIEPLQGGINNKSFRIHGQAGDYILRLYPISTKAENVAFEMAILSALSAADLSFQIPRPIPSRSGEMAPTVPTGNGEAMAVLVPVIAGSFCEPSSPAQAYNAGASLGELHRAMATIAVPLRPPYGQLEQIDPLLPDPREAAELPFLGQTEQKRLTRLLHEVMAERDHWYGSLPQQFIHSDYVPYNLLLVDDQVSAVLDFELAAMDLRALDFTMGLWAWLNWKGSLNWALGEAFVRGYTSQVPLSLPEVEAVPFLLRLRKAVTLVWWAGRHRQGNATDELLQWAATSALEAEDWIEANGAVLVERLRSWAGLVHTSLPAPQKEFR